MELYQSVIDQLSNKLISLLLYFQGEPFAHRDFLNLVRHAHSKGIYTMACVITWDGRFLPCCFDKDAEYPLGDTVRSSIASIWRGQGYREFRRKVKKSRKNISICVNGSEGCKIWL